ncbi:MAG: MarR family transcriptional regulator [Planctomycetota bacterium]
MPPDYQALAEVRHQIRRFLAFSERAALDAGLEPAQHQLLLAIVGLPRGTRPTIGALAERLLLKHHSAVELAGRLVRRRLVRRARSDQDGREVLLEVTAQGHRLLARLSVVHSSELRTRGPDLVKALQPLIGRKTRRGV